MALLVNGMLQHDLGLGNRVAASVSSLARALAPAVFGVVYASTTSSRLPFPFDEHAAFVLLALVCLATLLASAPIKSVESATSGVTASDTPAKVGERSNPSCRQTLRPSSPSPENELGAAVSPAPPPRCET